MGKLSCVLWAVAAVLLALSFCLLIPSGMLTDDAVASYYDAQDAGDDEDFADWDVWEEATVPTFKGLEPRAVLASAVFSDILPGNVTPLPIDLFAPGSEPDESAFTEDGYRDDTIIVEMRTERMYDSTVFIAYVQIATPSQLRTAVAGRKISSQQTDQTTSICQNYNAIVGINGDYYTKTKAGFIIREGQTYREKTSKNMDLLIIDELGDFHIIKRGHDNQKQAMAVLTSEHNPVNGFFFGPALVIDGVKQNDFEGYQFDPMSKNPRCGIAQLDVLTYALVVVNGRDESGDADRGIEPSAGVTFAEFADIMQQIGAKQAYNLDGGNSATLSFHGEMYNVKKNAERDVTDIIYFASAAE